MIAGFMFMVGVVCFGVSLIVLYGVLKFVHFLLFTPDGRIFLGILMGFSAIVILSLNNQIVAAVFLSSQLCLVAPLFIFFILSVIDKLTTRLIIQEKYKNISLKFGSSWVLLGISYAVSYPPILYLFLKNSH